MLGRLLSRTRYEAVAYQADILINVKGFQDLGRIQKALEGTAQKIDAINASAARLGAPVRNVERFTQQLLLAEKALQKVAIGSPQEQRAITNYVTALNNSNTARDRQNKLIEQEIAVRNSATTAIRKNVEANIAESRAVRVARDEAKALNTELVQQERLRRKLADRGLMQLSTGEIAKGISNAGFGIQGPALPPTAQKPTARQGANTPKAGSAISNALIGGAFPLLFGQGAGAAAGGAIGGLVGDLTLGPAGGFAGSLIGTAVGAAADADQQIQKLAASLGLAGAAADSFGESFRKSGADLQTFTQAVDQIRDINVPFEQQATAIKLASAVSTNYKGSITAVATALKEVGSTGEVSVSTLTTLTKAGVPIVDSLARGFGVTKDKVIEMASEGKISVTELTAKLAELGNQERPLTGLDKISQAFSSLTATANQLFGPLLDALGNGLTGALEHVATWWTYLSDEAVPKFVNAIAPVTAVVSKAFPVDILQKAGDIFLEIGIRVLNTATYLASKLSPVLAIVVSKFLELSNNPVFKFIAEQVARLANMLGLNTAEADKFRAKQEEAAAASAKVTAEEQAKLDKALALNASLNERVALLQATQQISQASNAADKAELGATLQKLQANKESFSAINQIYATKKEMAALDYAAAQQQAAFSVQAAQNALEEARIKKEGVAAAEKNLSIAIAVANETLRGAAATEKSAIAAADLERRTATAAVAAQAYASSAARITERLNEASNSLNNQNNVYQSMVSALNTANNAQIQMLQTQLNTTQTVEQRLSTIRKIAALEKANARNTYLAAIAQINADIERLRIASALARVKELEALYTLNTAIAQKAATQAHWDAYYAAVSASEIAYDNYLTSIAVGKNMAYAAAVTYNAAVYAANMRVSTEQAAIAAGKYANNIGQAANNIATLNKSSSDTSSVSGTSVFFAKTNVVAKAAPIPGLQSIADAEVANQQASASLFSQENTSNYSFSAPAQSETAAATPNVNITTGPVVEFDGTKYVTLSDLESAVQNTVSGIVGRLRTPSARIALGIA